MEVTRCKCRSLDIYHIVNPFFYNPYMFPIQVLRRSDHLLNLQKKLIKLRRETDHPYQSSTDIGDCPTFSMSLSQIYVNIPYMEYLGRFYT